MNSVSRLQPLSVSGTNLKGIPLGDIMILWVDPQQKVLGIDQKINGTWTRIAESQFYQPSRPEKTNLLLIDLYDPHSPLNQPHIIRADDATKIDSRPDVIASGAFYGLWDCDIMAIYGNGHAQILVTVREMMPVPGRVWTNWYNYSQWEGWRSITPL